MGLLIYLLVLLVYLLLGLLLDGLVLLVDLLLGQLVDGLISLGPHVLLGLVSLGVDLLCCLLLLLFGPGIDLLLRFLFLLVGLGVDLLFRLLLRLLCLLLDLLRRFGLLFGDLLLRRFLLLVAELVEVGLVVVGRLAEAHGNEHGTVRAGAEPFCHRVVGLARLGVGGKCPVVRLSEVEVRDGQGEDDEHDKAHYQGRPGVGPHEGGPAGPAVGSLIVLDPHTGHAQAVDTGPDQAEDGGKQSDCRRGRDEYHDRGRVSECRHHRYSCGSQ